MWLLPTASKYGNGNITGLYPKAGRTEDGPSILNNAKAYIKGNKGGKLGLASVENISVAPAVTCYRSYDHSILNAIFLVFVSLPKVKLYNR